MPKKSKTPSYTQWIDFPTADLGKLKGSSGVAQLRKMLTDLRSGIRGRKASFTRAHIPSHALMTYESSTMFSLPKTQRPSVNKLTRNQLIMEIVKAQQFYHAKTSTIAGARLVKREAEKRIFGTDEKGNPRRQMTAEEAKQFWQTYNEFIRLHADMFYRLGSNQIQQLLSTSIQRDDHFGTTLFNLGDALADAQEYMDDWELEHL